MSHRARIRKTSAPAKTEAVRAVADSTQERSDLQRKSARTSNRKISKTNSAEDSVQVSADSNSHRRGKVSRKRHVQNEIDVLRPREPISSMGRQIPLTFTAQGNTLCTVAAAEYSNEFKEKTTRQSDSDADHEDSNILMRQWLERKANRGDLPGLQWHDKSNQLVRISWKHGSKSGWTSDDSHVFISWARCTGRYEPNCKGGFKRWKANFRCALNSLPDVEEVPEESGMKTADPYKVYRLLDPVLHRRVKRCSSNPLPQTHSYESTMIVETVPSLSVDTSKPVTLPPFATIVQTSPPTNPSAPIFAGWLQSNGQPMTQAVKFEQLSGDYIIASDDHSYADSKTDTDEHAMPQTVDIPRSTLIPTTVEHLNGETSDEDSEADENKDDSSVHSTTKDTRHHK